MARVTWSTRADRVEERLERYPSNPAKLAAVFDIEGEYYLDNDWFHPENQQSNYDPDYQGCRVEDLEEALQRWMKTIVKNPMKIENPYLEDSIHRIFQVLHWDVRSVVNDNILPYINKRLRREILRSRRAADQEEIPSESDCTVDEDYTRLATGEYHKSIASTPKEIQKWEENGTLPY